MLKHLEESLVMEIILNLNIVLNVARFNINFQFLDKTNKRYVYDEGNIDMPKHNNDWTYLKFMDWLRGMPKPEFSDEKGWRDWEKEAKTKYPWRYWLVEVGLEYLQDFITWPVRKVYDFECYIKNRWFTRTHALTAHPRDIRPGTWCDVGDRFIFCLFNELVNFVEVELASWHIAFADKEERMKYQIPIWTRKWRDWRCPQAGLDSLNWQSNLKFDEEWISEDDPKFGKPTPQAENAKEILELYKWWVEERPKRPDPMDESGWSAICNSRHETSEEDFFMFEGQAEDQKSTHALNLCHKIENAYEREDQNMMIRLIKIRHGLWT
jgi:hypothetical protein